MSDRQSEKEWELDRRRRRRRRGTRDMCACNRLIKWMNLDKNHFSIYTLFVDDQFYCSIGNNCMFAVYNQLSGFKFEFFYLFFQNKYSISQHTYERLLGRRRRRQFYNILFDLHKCTSNMYTLYDCFFFLLYCFNARHYTLIEPKPKRHMKIKTLWRKCQNEESLKRIEQQNLMKNWQFLWLVFIFFFRLYHWNIFSSSALQITHCTWLTNSEFLLIIECNFV